VEVILGLAALNSNLLFVIKKLLDEKVRLMLNTTSKYRFLHSQIISGYQIILSNDNQICLPLASFQAEISDKTAMAVALP
jgi:hypothetical protein